MGTKNFNILDTVIAKLRFRFLEKYIHNDDVVLDFGCGYQAYFLTYLKGKIKKGTGIDYEAENRKIGKNLEIMNFTYTRTLPFSSNTYSKVCMLAVIEHIPLKKVKKLLREIRRVLKPGGQLLLTTPTPKSKKFLEFLAFKLRIISGAEIADHKKYYAFNDIESLARETGFSINNHSVFMLGLNSFYLLDKSK